MRHRITSFRCVVGALINARPKGLFKSCIESYFRQSSMARAGSAHDGMMRIGAGAPSTATRPRLNAMASRTGSKLATALPTGSVRSLLVVMIRSSIPGAAPVRVKLTRRTFRVQRIVNCGPRFVWKTASLPPGMARYNQVPPLSGAERQLTAPEIGVDEAGVDWAPARANNIAMNISAPVDLPWLSAPRARHEACPLRGARPSPPCGPLPGWRLSVW